MSDTENTTPDVVENTEATTPTIESLQAEVDKWRNHARTWEGRAKDNQGAAEKLQEIEDANKSELEKLTEKATTLESELATARFDAMRQSIAAEYGISKGDTELFLTGADSDTLTAQAKALQERTAKESRVGVHIPGLQDRQTDDAAGSKDDFARSLFGI